METTSSLETMFSPGNKIQLEFLNRQGIKVTSKASIEYIERSQLILKVPSFKSDLKKFKLC